MDMGINVTSCFCLLTSCWAPIVQTKHQEVRAKRMPPTQLNFVGRGVGVGAAGNGG